MSLINQLLNGKHTGKGLKQYLTNYYHYDMYKYKKLAQSHIFELEFSVMPFSMLELHKP